ncbi:choice-of-anchor Q domain-containing protein [Pseudomonas indica]|uniref:CSLREA domain-containing protein n=1 Tax=Pseudomonas indica TaxID=137658 RepID=A0A1G9HH39_9PSED|nr:choice-of-anchor Q domain-containing protein [Pseudomonas indica]MBU3054597.1 hypothetical protein [Pseudomonas indica]PAU62047.1 hypothetical protein BZL42_06755 [Pseudomonas indica]SDL12300.1 hypothetical protein SAMN05216186_11541 [Pseudomonas indica]
MPAFPFFRALGALCLTAPFAATAADFVVDKTSDSFDPGCTTACSLRETLYRANAMPGSHRVILREATYSLTLPDPVWNPDEDPDPDEDDGVRGDLDIRGDITLVGASQDGSVIQGSTERLIEVLPDARLQLRRLTLRDGLADTYGGAVRNDGETVVHRVSFLNNRADAGIQGQGGAIANFASLSVSHALFEGNNSNGDEGFFGRGGAIFNRGDLLLRDSTLRRNSVTDSDGDYGQGGALYNEGVADVARTTFVDNAAGVPLFGGGGSAIANRAGGRLLLTNSTLSGNQGIETNGVLTNGFARFAEDANVQARLVNVTIAGNDGLGVSNSGNLLIRNSLVAGNRLGGSPANCATLGTYRAIGLLLGADTGNCTADVLVDDALTFRKVLHVLSNNKGTTQTHALRKGSPALDAGIGSCTRHDQRGVPRPQDGDGDGVAVCDLGAYERIRP